jgi:hypothetical protein
VWRVLTGFVLYPAWNPFIVSVSGSLEGRRLAVRIQPWEGRIWRFRPRIVRLSEERELCWLGRLGVPWLFDGRHCFALEPDGPGRTRFAQRETFRGLLVPLVPRSVFDAVARGFEAMNEALRERAEREQRPRADPAAAPP